MLADGIKLGKEARRMPALKTLPQDSDNSSKAPFIRSHHFGFVGLLVGSLTKAFCLPLRGQLHAGIEGLREELGWQDHLALASDEPSLKGLVLGVRRGSEATGISPRAAATVVSPRRELPPPTGCPEGHGQLSESAEQNRHATRDSSHHGNGSASSGG